MKGAALFIVGLLAGFALSLLVGRRQGTDEGAKRPTRTVHIDTLRHDEPVAKDSIVLRYQTVRLALAPETLTVPQTDTLRAVQTLHDSVQVTIPITQRTYGDSTYTAWVSGYDARLDSIHVRQQTVTLREPAADRRWSIGVNAGLAVTPKGVQPYVGIGIQYRLWNIGKRK